MSLPETLFVLTQRYAVETFAHLHNEDGEELAGDVDQEHHIIRLATGFHEDEVAETLLHEFLHVLLHKANYGSVQMGEEENEALVNSLAPILLSAIRENEHLMHHLKGY